ncbi:hypothetical protein C0992_011249 [Termitomyces sp. T32_za158]|nr:hypothetical protein C0992_011249 [Termitomyces sp. T32_za158]
MFFVTQFLRPPARRGTFSVVKGLGVMFQWLAFVTSLWCILLNALSPDTKTFTTLFAIHPISSLSSLFTHPPTPPSKAAKPIKAPRHEEALKSAPNTSSIALFVCFAVAHTISRHVPDVLETQRKPAVSDGRGIEESLDIIPVPNPPSDEVPLVKPVATSGRGIEESSDVTTTPLHESTSNEGDVDTDEQTDEINHDGPQILCNAAESVDTSVTDIHGFLAVLYVLAATEKTDDEQLRALARRIRAHEPRRGPETTTQEATDNQESKDKVIDEHSTAEEELEADREMDTTELKEIATAKSKDVQAATKSEEHANLDANGDDDAGEWFTIRKGKTVKASSRPVLPQVHASTETESKEDASRGTMDEAIDEPTTAGIEMDAERGTELEVVEEDDAEETKVIEEEPEVLDNQETKYEVIDERATAEVKLNARRETDSEDVEVEDDVEETKDADCDTEPEELDVGTTESGEMAVEKSNDVQVRVVSSFAISRKTNDLDVGGGEARRGCESGHQRRR